MNSTPLENQTNIPVPIDTIPVAHSTPIVSPMEIDTKAVEKNQQIAEKQKEDTSLNMIQQQQKQIAELTRKLEEQMNKDIIEKSRKERSEIESKLQIYIENNNKLIDSQLDLSPELREYLKSSVTKNIEKSLSGGDFSTARKDLDCAFNKQQKDMSLMEEVNQLKSNKRKIEEERDNYKTLFNREVSNKDAEETRRKESDAKRLKSEQQVKNEIDSIGLIKRSEPVIHTPQKQQQMAIIPPKIYEKYRDSYDGITSKIKQESRILPLVIQHPPVEPNSFWDRMYSDTKNVSSIQYNPFSGGDVQMFEVTNDTKKYI